ncbi:NAD(P)/FAD-dependent oxidoreductase [Saccharicrinis sp. 156]|uniref:NAD(P)/FAD-dependent oxidoreductase n=1 Tax=Saccharicrinis sp. 156 TaxID=3417574 RepID=UPI003D352486
MTRTLLLIHNFINFYTKNTRKMIVKDFIIIGGGIAGLSAIKAIRDENNSGSILWITDEDRLPYKRTKINKHINVGFSKDDFALIDHDWLVDNQVELLFDKVESIDTHKHELSFLHRGNLRYSKLIVATGNKPKHLQIEGIPDDIVFNVHTARQVDNIIRSASSSKSYLVVGAGVEGVETADQLAQKGKEVILVDRNPIVLQRFLTPKFADLLQDSIRKAGIQLILDARDLRFIVDRSGNNHIQIDHRQYKCDRIISTIGYTPNIDLASDANIKCNFGILVDEHLQTSATDVYAAGDVAEHTQGIVTGLWHAAEHQGKIAGMNACGKKEKLVLKPFRMKTEVFGEYYFSVPPLGNNLELTEEKNGDKVRDMYFANDRLEALLMKNDGERAKMYQKALMEKWSLHKIKNELPL